MIFGSSPIPRVAYFCMEYGLDVDLTLYAGGLGVLAGDFLKAAGDLSMPVVGVGLMWDQGYTDQHVRHGGSVTDDEVPTRRDCLEPVDAEIFVTIKGEEVACQAWRVTRYVETPLYVLEPRAEKDRWITKRLYGGSKEHRVAQEMLLGIGGVRLLRALDHEVDIYHFNEGHAVFAGLELIRELTAEGMSFEAATQRVRNRIVFTTHTPVPAGNETHPLDLLEETGADLVHERADLERLGGDPFSMTVAGLKLAARANAVSQLHGDTARKMWAHVEDAAPIAGITNGVHAPTWQDPRIRAAVVGEKPLSRRAQGLWDAHQRMKRELLTEIAARTGSQLADDHLLIGFARRAAQYKRAPLILRNPGIIEPLLAEGKVQLVFAGKAHPADEGGKRIIGDLVRAAERWNALVYLENYDMRLGALLTRGCDVWLNNPRRPMEASGTSGMKAAMNGVLNLSILDGWWPEGCRHGVTGWRIGGHEDADDERDAANLYHVLQSEVLPRYYQDRDAWIDMMMASVEMASWRFSAARMVEDYYRRLYCPPQGE